VYYWVTSALHIKNMQIERKGSCQKSGRQKTAQQSVHPTLGILATSQAFFYASAFLQSDGVPPPDPARVTQTVSWLT
jgi:hypothetical protein